MRSLIIIGLAALAGMTASAELQGLDVDRIHYRRALQPPAAMPAPRLLRRAGLTPPASALVIPGTSPHVEPPVTIPPKTRKPEIQIPDIDSDAFTSSGVVNAVGFEVFALAAAVGAYLL
ncbi:hypothetical protein PpBr36_05461 [Pyricularia pennisetigena]|uniref:hypothetical protein n=1 Tax=Pyricularia pennisetigena TaxID=1578925 RepID=UPI001154D604|nr:hypothetical protein PpBr36_05461 [Pyricularia pennisetigena]TLS27451.1 hypothetical protein PpBr36_05461 [Pyricularia pennisetigena]